MKTTINFRVKEEQKEDLQILADQRCVKISVIIREIISDYLWELKYTKSDKKSNEIILHIPSSPKEITLYIPQPRNNLDN